MARSGPKAKAKHLHLATGTDQPCRRTGVVVKSLPGIPERPKWLKGEARKIWDKKIEIYRKRGQDVVGLEARLADYCALEARLIEDYWKKNLLPPAAYLTQVRVFGNEFFDTSASQLVRPKGNKPDNKFLNHVRQ